MATATHDIDIVFSGDVFDVHLELEGLAINLFFDFTKRVFVRQLKAFPVTDDLNLFLRVKGLNDTRWDFAMAVDNKGPFKKSERITKGVSRVLENIKLPLQDAK
jgi:hypothetical protein